MKTRAFVVSVLVGLAISGFGTALMSSACRHTQSAQLSTRLTKNAANQTNYAHIDDTLPATDDGGLFISVVNSTKTDLGESYTLRFSANTVLYPIGTSGTNKFPQTKGIYVTPNDDSYPADKTLKELTKYDVDLATVTADAEEVEKDEQGNAKIDDEGHYVLVAGHDYSYKMPSYNAYVSRIDATNTSRNGPETIVIPYSVTFGSWFNLRVTEFGEKVVYNSSTRLTEEDSIYDGIKTIVIGDNIENIPENALQDAPADLVIKSTFDSMPGGWNENFTKAKVEFGYNPSEQEKQIFDMDPKTDAENNVLYYDTYGALLNEENKYIDENRQVIQEENSDGELVDKVFDGVAITYPKAFEFKAGNYKSQASEMTFMIGNVDESKGINLPLLFKYDAIKADGSREERVYECPFEDSNAILEAIGSESGKYSFTKNIDIRLDEGESIDQDSIKLYNIFEANLVQNGSVYELVANEDNAYMSVPAITFSNKTLIENIFEMKFDSVNSIFGYTSIGLKVNLVPGIYEQAKASTFKNYEARINEGKYKIRYSFRDFNKATYYMEYGDNKVVECGVGDVVNGGIPTDLDFLLFKQQKNNSLTFFFDNRLVGGNINATNIKKAELCGFRVTLDLCSTERGTTQIVTKSAVSFRFGYLNLLPEEANSVSKFNGDVFLIIYSIAFLVLFFGGTVGYYFFAKAKYKNDEFRRINGKAYSKRMAKAFIGAFLIAGAIAFVFLRFFMINPSIVAFNPLDPFVIGFGVFGLIAFGYFIKFFVLYIKQVKERRKILKLKLNEDVESDGTN